MTHQTRGRAAPSEETESSEEIPNKTRALTIKLTPDQYESVERRAGRCGVKMAIWARSIVLQAATRQGEQGYVRIKEPNGATT